MLDADLLRKYALVLLITGLFFLTVDGGDIAAKVVFILSVFLVVVSWAIKPNKIDIKVKDIFEDNETSNQFKEKFSQDPEFNQALVYVHNLDRASFLRFFRLAVEVRLKADQHLLKDAARLYRAGEKK